ncbi:citrate synthase family protein [Aurantivibrio infirmus]
MSDSNNKSDKANDVVRRNDEFVEKPVTKIWSEKPSKSNPYIAEEARCHGYELVDLLTKRSYVDVLYLLFKGELPSKKDAKIFEKLMIAFINPGPRHPGVRAAMNAGVGKTDPSHILPIGLSIIGGTYLGAEEVELSMRWLRRNSKRNPKELVLQLTEDNKSIKNESGQIAPGFGSRFDDIDLMPQRIADSLLMLPGKGKVLEWGNGFAKELNDLGAGWYSTGVVAAVLCDLGFLPRVGPGIFQLISAPGIFAHGIEMANKTINAMPFPEDAKYYMETEDPIAFEAVKEFEEN